MSILIKHGRHRGDLLIIPMLFLHDNGFRCCPIDTQRFYDNTNGTFCIKTTSLRKLPA